MMTARETLIFLCIPSAFSRRQESVNPLVDFRKEAPCREVFVTWKHEEAVFAQGVLFFGMWRGLRLKAGRSRWGEGGEWGEVEEKVR